MVYTIAFLISAGLCIAMFLYSQHTEKKLMAEIQEVRKSEKELIKDIRREMADRKKPKDY